MQAMLINRKKGFTLIELLVVMSIIAILAGLIITIIPYVNKKQARTAAEGQIRTIESALETYKSDNGNYPNDATMGAGSYTSSYTDSLDARTNNDPTNTSSPSSSPGSYTHASLVLYRALSWDLNLDRKWDGGGTTDSTVDLDGNSLGTPLGAPPTVYMQFPKSMLSPANGLGNVTALVDPFGEPYGYSTAYQGDLANGISPPTHGYNTTYDLWSTGGNVGQASDSTTTTSLKRSQWLYNWQNSGANVGQ